MVCAIPYFFFFFSSRRRHTRLQGDWSSDVCSSDLAGPSQRRGVEVEEQGSPPRLRLGQRLVDVVTPRDVHRDLLARSVRRSAGRGRVAGAPEVAPTRSSASCRAARPAAPTVAGSPRGGVPAPRRTARTSVATRP